MKYELFGYRKIQETNVTLFNIEIVRHLFIWFKLNALSRVLQVGGKYPQSTLFNFFV